MEITPGQVYGHLTVVEPVMVSGNRCWRYRCICGKTGVKRPAHIRTKGSCGCLVGKPEGDWISTKKAMEMLGHRDHGSFHAYARNNEISRSTDVNNPYRVWWSGADIRLHAEKREKERTSERLCAECGGLNSKGYSDYCSNKCGRTAAARKLKAIYPKHKKPCKHCGQLFESTTKVYCSEECQNQPLIQRKERRRQERQRHAEQLERRRIDRWLEQFVPEPKTPDELTEWLKMLVVSGAGRRSSERIRIAKQRQQIRELKEASERSWLAWLQGKVKGPKQETEEDLWIRRMENWVGSGRKRQSRKSQSRGCGSCSSSRSFSQTGQSSVLSLDAGYIDRM